MDHSMLQLSYDTQQLQLPEEKYLGVPKNDQ